MLTDLLAHGRGRRGTLACQLVLQRGHRHVHASARRIPGCARPRVPSPAAGAACSHTSMTSSAWWLLYFRSCGRPRGSGGTATRRRGAGRAWRRARAAGGSGRRTRPSAGRRAVPRAAGRPGSPTGRARWRRRPGGPRARCPAEAPRRCCWQRRVLAQHRADRVAELAPPFVRLVLVGEQWLQAQMRQLVGVGDRRRPRVSSSRPPASRTPKGSGDSSRRCSGEKGIELQTSGLRRCSAAWREKNGPRRAR